MSYFLYSAFKSVFLDRAESKLVGNIGVILKDKVQEEVEKHHKDTDEVCLVLCVLFIFVF